jgi:hypothetical protein
MMTPEADVPGTPKDRVTIRARRGDRGRVPEAQEFTCRFRSGSDRSRSGTMATPSTIRSTTYHGHRHVTHRMILAGDKDKKIFEV